MSTTNNYIALIKDEVRFRSDPMASELLHVKVSDFITEHVGNRPIFNVMDYGAVGDGVTDDIVPIQAAVDAAQVKGGRVFIKQHKISSPILIRNSGVAITIYGNGFDISKIILANEVNDYAIKFTLVNTNSLSGYVFEDFSIDGNYSGQNAGGCIYALGAVECHFNRLHLHHAYDNALYLYQDGNGGIGHHNRITSCLFDNSIGSAGDGRAIRMESSDENFIIGNDFENNGRAASSLPTHVLDLSGLQIITNNTFVNGTTAVRCDFSSRTIISNNIFDNVNDHNVLLKGSDHICMGNQFFAIGGGGNSAIVDGVFADNVTGAIITGNYFGASASATRSGINFSFSVANLMVTNNRFGTDGTFGSGKILITGSGHIIRNNFGFITENGGTATVTSGATTVVVTHGLSYTPVNSEISIMPITSLGSATSFYVDTINSTSFTIHTNVAPGGSGAQFAWNIRRI